MVVPRPLNERFLTHHAARVSVPRYDRASLRRGVVHISVGSFHRSHQAVYFDELARRGHGDGWAVTGVGLHRRDMKEALDAQDGLYTVVTRGRLGDSARVVGVITRYLFAPQDREAVLDTLVDRRTRLVTLTITANGYNVDLETGAFAADDPAVVHDLAHPTAPHSALGLLVEALDRRRRSGSRPFTVLSCDNIASNGRIARTAVISMAALRDQRLADWVATNVAFPDSMVDRITPTTTGEDRTMVERTFGVRDRWPVITESFSQWVIEDRFHDEPPPLDKVGVQFVDDVRPYALSKTRLLNASHTAVGYLGSLAGHSYLHETMDDPAFPAYMTRMMDDEIVPLLPASGIDLSAYTASLRERLTNSRIADPLARLCRNGSTKVPGHVLPSIREAKALRRPSGLLTLAVAAWCRYLRGVDDDGRCIELDDPCGDVLRALALAGGDDPRPLLSHEPTFGSLGACPQFAEEIANDLRELGTDGARAVVSRRALADMCSVPR